MILSAVLAGVAIGYVCLGGSIVLVVYVGRKLGLWKDMT